MGWLFGLMCGLGGLFLVLLVLGALLRLAVSLTNRSLAPGRPAAPPPRSGGIPEWDWDDWDDGADERAEPQRPWRAPRAIPEPGTVKSMGIVLLTGMGYGFTYLMTGFAAQGAGFRMHRDETQFAVAVLNLPLGVLMLAALLSIVLPTRFWRAVTVAIVFGLVLVAVAMFIGCVVGGLAAFIR